MLATVNVGRKLEKFAVLFKAVTTFYSRVIFNKFDNQLKLEFRKIEKILISSAKLSADITFLMLMNIIYIETVIELVNSIVIELVNY